MYNVLYVYVKYYLRRQMTYTSVVNNVCCDCIRELFNYVYDVFIHVEISRIRDTK